MIKGTKITIVLMDEPTMPGTGIVWISATGRRSVPAGAPRGAMDLFHHDNGIVDDQRWLRRWPRVMILKYSDPVQHDQVRQRVTGS